MQLRRAFLKIGWAPIITVAGSLIVGIIGAMASIPDAVNLADFHIVMSNMKLTVILASVISILGYLLTYIGFAQAHKQLGWSKPGNAFATLKTVFIIFLIIQVIMFILMLVMPSAPDTYIDMANNLAADQRGAATVGIVLLVIYLIIAVYSIVALFIIKSQMSTIARTTNIASLHSAATGARWGVYSLFIAVGIGIASAFIESATIIGLISLVFLGICIFALVKWICGWLGAASEVLGHPVEIQDYDDAQAQA